jgi:hypothetical protein
MAEEKIVHVRIYAKDAKALKALPMAQMDMGCMGGIKRQEDGGLAFEALIPESVMNMKTVKDKRIKLEVLADALEESRERQKQVGKGNRFTGENWIPRGLGKKIREEAQP